MSETPSPEEMILNIIKEKSVLKQNVFSNMNLNFKILKQVLKELCDTLNDEMEGVDERIMISYVEKGEYEAELRVAGDVLVFHMHTNVFQFDTGHSIWKTSYLKENSSRAYCGIINVYNFLNDSFKYNRINDSGYLIARIFINNESHFMVQGKRQMGFLYNDFVNAMIDKEQLTSIVNSAILYTLDFDLLTPPYENVKEVKVHEMRQLTDSLQLKTGKRLGFRFQADTDEIE
jgi:hypothetical protein